MVAQLGKKEKACYGIGHVLPHVLMQHWFAWIDADRVASDDLSANLRLLADSLGTVGQSVLAAQVQEIEANWRRCFRSAEYLAWSAVMAAIRRMPTLFAWHVGSTNLAEKAINRLSALAHRDKESRPLQSGRAVRRIIKQARKGAGKSSDEGIIRAISEAMVPTLHDGKPRPCHCAEGCQDSDYADRELVRITLEKASSLFAPGRFLVAPSKLPMALPLMTPGGGLELAALCQSPVYEEIGQVCLAVSDAAQSGLVMGSIWFCLGLHVGLLETGLLSIPKDLVTRYPGAWVVPFSASSLFPWRRRVDPLVSLARDEVGRLQLGGYVQQRAAEPAPTRSFRLMKWAGNLHSAIEREFSLPPVAASPSSVSDAPSGAVGEQERTAAKLPVCAIGGEQTEPRRPGLAGADPAEASVVLVTFDPKRSVVALDFGTGKQVHVSFPAKSDGSSVLLEQFGLLIERLSGDLAADVPRKDAGWLSYQALLGDAGAATAPPRLRARLSRLNHLLAESLTVAGLSKDALVVASTRKGDGAYRLEGTLLDYFSRVDVLASPPADPDAAE